MADTLKVNMTDKEAQSTDREPLPSGKFHYKITDVDLNYTKETSKHPHEPYLAFEFTVQDGKYEGRKDWANAMCFANALYTISQILKALGHEINPKGGEVNIPIAREFYIGKDLWGRRGPDKNQKTEDGTSRIQLQGFSKYTTGTSTPGAPAESSKAKASVLP